MKKIIVIFDSSQQTMEEVILPSTVNYNEDYELNTLDINDRKPSIRKKAISLLYQHGTNNTPLYLFKNAKDTYNSHYFEHGPLTKEIALKKLNDG